MTIRTVLSAAALGTLLSIATQANAASTTTQTRYVVNFKSGMAAQGVAAVKAKGGTIKRNFTTRYGAVAVMLPPAKAKELASDPNVASIQVDAKRYPFAAMRSRPSGADKVAVSPSVFGDASQTVPYGIALVQAEGYEGNADGGMKVCVIDTGYDLGHEDLPGTDVVSGSDDLSGAGPWAVDGYGHGTHVAGTISALDNELGVLGVFPGVSLHIVRVFGDNGLWAYSSDLVAALDKCRTAGAKVVNMSLGGPDPSVLENNAFRKAEMAGVLSIAAAGNDGFGRGLDCADYGPRQACTMHYPAAYNSVVSVAAVGSDAVAAGFSQRNAKVELAAPGVAVLSTVPRGHGPDSSVSPSTGMGEFAMFPMDGFTTPTDPVTGDLVDCGLGGSAAACGDATGKICLIERGSFTFAVKAQSCEAAGGIGAVVFNKAGETGPVNGTLGGTLVGIPVVGTERATGLGLRAGFIGTSATLTFTSLSNYDYDFYSGTSMATPHVAGVAALIWSTHPQCSNLEVRQALGATAIDLGAPKRDHTYGFGLIQARAASDYLDSHGCAAH